MQFVKTIRDQLGITNYRLSKELCLPEESVRHLQAKARAIRPETLCHLRAMSGLSWSRFGKLLDAEFAPKKKGNKDMKTHLAAILLVVSSCSTSAPSVPRYAQRLLGGDNIWEVCASRDWNDCNPFAPYKCAENLRPLVEAKAVELCGHVHSRVFLCETADKDVIRNGACCHVDCRIDNK